MPDSLSSYLYSEIHRHKRKGYENQCVVKEWDMRKELWDVKIEEVGVGYVKERK